VATSERFYQLRRQVLILSLLSINFDKGTVPFVNMLLHLWMLFLLLPIVAFGDDMNVVSDPIVMGYLYTALLLVIAPYVFNSQQTVGHSSPHIRRQRRDVSSMFHELGPIYSRRAYRMDTDSFWALHRLLRPHLKGRVRPASLRSKKKRGAVNGVIPSTIRLSIALRYFAGGSSYDISLTHGVSHTEVYKSVWLVVDAVNTCKKLNIEFPSDHVRQREIAEGFAKKSSAFFKMCVGAIDGIMIWIEQPRVKECVFAGCGPKKFFCGRKKKFGLNMQATCDANGLFLDVSICHPGATSDFLAFSTSPLKHLLETRGFLAPGLCLFGDNAYVNTYYMCTPFKAVSSGTKDDYNFYQSQVRINIECAFGKLLVYRWGIIWRAIPSSIGIQKTTALVTALCKLHNYCINRRLAGISCSDDIVVPSPLSKDSAVIAIHGGIPMEQQAKGLNNSSPEQLLRGGEHFDDVSQNLICQMEREEMRAGGALLPRDILHDSAIEQGLTRSTLPR
jgi:hypothetical protein